MPEKTCYYHDNHLAQALVVGQHLDSEGKGHLRKVWVCEACLTDSGIWVNTPRILKWRPLDLEATCLTPAQKRLITTTKHRSFRAMYDDGPSYFIQFNSTQYMWIPEKDFQELLEKGYIEARSKPNFPRTYVVTFFGFHESCLV